MTSPRRDDLGLSLLPAGPFQGLEQGKAMSSTNRLIYASLARPGLSYQELTSILSAARDTNERLGITGVLCYGNGAFLQALEGESAAVSRLFHRIAADRRHTHCQLLRYGEITTRNFAGWSMKVIGLEGSERQALLRRAGFTLFEPCRMNGRTADDFLRALAELERLGPLSRRHSEAPPISLP